MPDSEKSPHVNTVPPMPMVMVSENITMFLVSDRSTLCFSMFATPAVAMVPKRSSISPPSTACGMVLRNALILPTRENTMAVTAAILMTCGFVTLVIEMAPVTSE